MNVHPDCSLVEPVSHWNLSLSDSGEYNPKYGEYWSELYLFIFEVLYGIFVTGDIALTEILLIEFAGHFYLLTYLPKNLYTHHFLNRNFESSKTM